MNLAATYFQLTGIRSFSVFQLCVEKKLSGINAACFFRNCQGMANESKSAGIRVRAAMSKFPITALFSPLRANFSGNVTKAMHDDENGASTRSKLAGESKWHKVTSALN